MRLWPHSEGIAALAMASDEEMQPRLGGYLTGKVRGSIRVWWTLEVA